MECGAERMEEVVCSVDIGDQPDIEIGIQTI